MLKIDDVRRREIRTLVNEFQTEATYTINCDANELSSGIYIYKLYVGSNFVETKKMMLVR